MEALQPLQVYLQKIESRLSAIESLVSGGKMSVAEPTPEQPMSDDVPKQIAAYDDYVRSYLTPFLQSCEKLGPDVVQLGNIVKRAFDAQRQFLVTASKSKKPSTNEMMELLKDLQSCTKAMNDSRDNRSEYSHHQNMLNEGIQALGWLCVEPAPRPFIESYIGGSDFWGNKIRVQFKQSNPDQIEFVKTFNKLLNELMVYVKEYHTTGVTWNPTGTSGGINNVFEGIKSIDQSSGKTAGLRTVTKDMQTWRKEYKGESSAVVKAKAAKVDTSKPSKPAVLELKNGKWVIEYQGGTGSAPVTVSDINMKQQVYIFGCVNATIILEGKAKSIVLDNSRNTKLIFDNAVSSIEIVNCKKVQVQCKGRVPSVAIDKTDGCLVYVSYEGKSTQFVTSKSSEMNVAFPESATSDEYKEVPIPEQFVHKIMDNDKISSEVSDLYSG